MPEPLKESKKKKGGARPGAGMPKGYKTQKTLDKEAARVAVREVVIRHMNRMLQSQIAHAIGIGHLYTRDKTGKFNKIENQAEVDRLLREGNEDEDYWIFTKDPSVQAFTDLMNRALDKPKEQEQEIKVTGEITLIDKLLAGRKRAAEAHASRRT